ncbi:hypothetical protein GH742_09895 [Legionella sp. MW5194]|uniref:hypothetical protein n=1 Tax=Legionella sp. MW5194 TaxID=2662448 RepID=UPI00193D94CC|nr:hypothetical protein [Legionella sp. MW5194]QRN04160.1 hypothetical protein GH742_09895 [Legionella sp. MW5194]
MQDGEHYAGGLRIHFYEGAELEPLDGLEGWPASLAIARNALRILTMGWQDEVKSLLTHKVLKAVFWSRDQELMRAMRVAFQQGFDHVFHQLQGKQLDPLQQRQAELYISQCLSLLPFSDITPYECFTIPQCINKRWQMVHYKVVPIELTPVSGFKKLFLSEEDRVFAYGLEPINHPDASPHLVFMGTTYPAGQGFVSQVNTDLEGFETAGKKLYRNGRDNMVRWLNRQGRKPCVCGTSLGGALSLLLAIDQGDKLCRVDAFNPPGLYKSWLKKSRYDRWEDIRKTNKNLKVRVYKQGDDPISKFGEWKEDWDIVHVIPSEVRKKQLNPLTDHAMIYSGYEDTQFVGVDTRADNEERKKRNFWLYGLLRGVFYYSVLVPFRYGALPALRYLWAHKRQVSLILGFLTLFLLFPALIPVLAIPGAALLGLLVSAFCSALIWGYFSDLMLTLLYDDFTFRKRGEFDSFLNWVSERPVWVKALLGTGIVLIAATMLVVPFIPVCAPLVTPAFFLALAAVPFLAFLTYCVIKSIQTLAGLNKPTIADCHDPLLPRNPEKDIYRKEMSARMSIQDLGDYHFATRRLLNDKPYLPLSGDEYRERYAGLSKREVLEKSQNAEEATQLIQVKASEAKIHEMQQIVSIARRFGFQKSPACVQELKAVHDDYQQGNVRPRDAVDDDLNEENRMCNWV